MWCDVLVVGAGAAGMAAALSAREAGAEAVLLADRNARLGGVLPQCLHSGFGAGIFHREMTGAEYAARWAARVVAASIPFRLDTTVLSVSPERRALLSGPEGVEEIDFQALVLAAGCREIPIGTLALPGTRPAGIFTAGQAQRMVNLQGYSRQWGCGAGHGPAALPDRMFCGGCGRAAGALRRDAQELPPEHRGNGHPPAHLHYGVLRPRGGAGLRRHTPAAGYRRGALYALRYADYCPRHAPRAGTAPPPGGAFAALGILVR